jgi:predicted CXXCH cytochrome family protein
MKRNLALAVVMVLVLSPLAFGQAVNKPTVVTGKITLKKQFRDTAGEIVRTEVVPGDGVTVNFGAKVLKGRDEDFRLELEPGNHAYFAETTLKWKVKKGATKQIVDRYWAAGALRIQPGGPSAVTRDLELVLVEDSQAFCRGCHPDVRQNLFQVQSCHHSTGVPLKEVYLKAFATSKLSLEGNLVVCITCHTTHQPTAFTKFLRKGLAKSELCLNCHP